MLSELTAAAADEVVVAGVPTEHLRHPVAFSSEEVLVFFPPHQQEDIQLFSAGFRDALGEHQGLAPSGEDTS